jgi:hypothetical protein
MLQVNNGDGSFSEIGQMAGIHQTEWSWSSMFVDVDNDGFRDLLVTNGFPKDVTDKDYVMFKREVGAFNNQRSLIDSIPVLKISNYAFKNNGDFSFTDNTKAWGMFRPSFSNGAAFADLDNDGDLDYVVNNINDFAFLYENTLYNGNNDQSKNNYLRLRLVGDSKNKSGLGARITIKYDGKSQFHDQSIYRGYLSTVENVVHFGLGTTPSVDTLTVLWPDNTTQSFYNVPSNQVLEVEHSAATPLVHVPSVTSEKKALVTEVSNTLGINYRHNEWDKVDFYRQRTLPHKFSQAGPGIAVGDVDGNRLEDFIVGGSSLYDAVIFLQQHDGSFRTLAITKTEERKSEDEGLLLFDADGDNDLDLYVVSGSYEAEAEDPRYQDRLYLNNGIGKFTLSHGTLPSTLASGSCVRAADFDSDGDLDLFVGGRVLAGAYPMPPQSYLLRNDGGKFTDITTDSAPGLSKIGMITDALFTDIDNDHHIDLVVVGEFMPITFFRNTGKSFERIQQSGLDSKVGWWNGIAAADFDKDGDTDYIIGNLGKNNYYNITEDQPVRVYAKDFDANESIDAILSCYFKSEEGDMVEYPAHFWDELNSQSPKFRNQFSSYKQYGATSMEKLLSPYDTSGMLVLTTNYSQSGYVENLGNGKFVLKPLPKLAQVSPVNGIVVTDLNDDGNPDALLIGNDYGNEVFSGRLDAATGLILLGDGAGEFTPVTSYNSGFKVDGDAKALSKLKSAKGHELIIASQNLDSLRIFKITGDSMMRRFFDPTPLDSWLVLEYEDGTREKKELYHGAGYLSQSTRAISIPSTVRRIKVYDFNGNERTIEYQTPELTSAGVATSTK